MAEIFIDKIKINDVRHLKNLEINLSSDERKHLILTGKNGSGKTSLLEVLRTYFTGFFEWISLEDKREKRKTNKDLIVSKPEHPLNEIHVDTIKRLDKDIENIEKGFSALCISLTNKNALGQSFIDGDFITAYFSTSRLDKPVLPKGINKLNLKSYYGINENIRDAFIQYIVNLKARSSFAREKGDMKTANEIGAWFQKFESCLKTIFNDDTLILDFDIDNLTFNILINNRQKFGFDTLSDGYSALLNIVMELILRMENKKTRNYSVQGIVFIDEIETHLHIDLQKKILPFLTNFFPKIQFIVTTHSPFILNSINNAIVYDLENRMQVEDLSGYSIEAIIEGYFDNDNYSNFVKNKMAEYERLLIKPELGETEKEQLYQLRHYLRNLPKFNAPELELRLNQLEFAYKS